jgi:phosphoenolpyruvate synthase/pyruvate phosphate dikinase
MLQELNLISLNQLRATDSGKTCGPKAANLGELKYLFPDKVVEGFIIPFGVFRQHLEQAMPGTQTTYWQFLQETFTLAAAQRDSGKSEEEVEAFTIKKLGELANAIKTMPLLNNFQENLKFRFKEIFGVEMGKLPVFIRSDTNMEDLKDFTGAGLNLTVFNVLDEEKILQGIKDVWASPYSERSYRWRQKYLLNPENVYPSILILPTVNVEKSGVMITTDVQTANSEDNTVAFNYGAGGAVEGQKAESYLLRHDGRDWLLTPCRENKYTSLPETGGTKKAVAYFNEPLLSADELAELGALAEQIKTKLLAEVQSTGPWDIELGFKDGRIWLFQVRPFVENKKSASSAYLRTLDPQFPKDVRIALDAKLQARTE